MSAKGYNFAEEGHVVNIMPPKDYTGAAYDSDVFSLRDHSHVSIIVQLGVTGAITSTLKVQACDDFVPTNTTDLAFSLYKEETASGDTLGARTAVASTGYSIAPADEDNIFYVIELDATELLTATKPHLRITLSSPGASALVSAVAILSGSRYGQDQSATEIA